MSDKQTVIEMLNRAGVLFYEEKRAITIVSIYTPIMDDEQHVHTLFEFDVDGKLITCRGYRGEDY